MKRIEILPKINIDDEYESSNSYSAFLVISILVTLGIPIY